MTKERKEEFLKDLKEICEKHCVSFTTARTILHQNAFFPVREKVKIHYKRKARACDLENKAKQMQSLMEEINKVNKSNFIAII